MNILANNNTNDNKYTVNPYTDLKTPKTIPCCTNRVVSAHKVNKKKLAVNIFTEEHSDF